VIIVNEVENVNYKLPVLSRIKREKQPEIRRATSKLGRGSVPRAGAVTYGLNDRADFQYIEYLGDLLGELAKFI